MVRAGTAHDPPAQGQFLAAVSRSRERVRDALDRPEALLGELAAVVAGLVDAPVTVALDDGNTLVRRSVTSGAPLPAGTAVQTDGTVCGEAWTCGRPVRIDDISDLEHPGPDGAGIASSAAACCPGARTLLTVPVLAGAKVVGVVAVTGDEPGRFDRMDEHAIALVVQVAAPVLADLPPYPFGAPREQPAPERSGLEQSASERVGSAQPVAGRSGSRQSPSGGAPPRQGGAPRALPIEPAPGAAVMVHAPRAGSDDAPDHVEPVLRRGLDTLGAARRLRGLGVFEWRTGAAQVTLSSELYHVLGLDPESFRPTPEACRALVHPDDLAVAAAVPALVRGSARRDGALVETFRVRGGDGALRSVQVWAVAIVDAPGAVVVRGAVVDVTAQARDRALLERLSTTDAVTGLGNRIAFERRMRELLAGGDDVALLLLDLDRFKLVNDSLGHQVGDRLLAEVARRLGDVVPQGSTTARMGGDEFVVVPPAGTDWLQVRRLAQVLVDALRAPYVLPESGQMLVCPASVGLTRSAGRGVGTDELFSEADLALYRAKDSGRDRYVVYDDALRARARARHHAEMLLRTALEQDRLKLQYQPIVDFEHGRVVGAEALVRVLDPGGERLLPPDVFIEVAEDTGLVVELDLWVIDAAIAQLAHWVRHAPPGTGVPWVAVNVSARSMEHPRVVRRLLDGMQRSRIGPELMKVELTEHSFLGTLPGGETTLRQLLASGVPVGIDDFGTGYSAMAYLNRFDLDFMKIDRSFVAKVGQEDRADAVVTAIVDLAHAHGMLVTAEGVETQKQARRLREIGCDLAQGYHFGRPADASRLLRV